MVEDGAQRVIRAGVDYPDGNGYDGEIQAMVTAIQTGGDAPVTLADAAATQRLLDREIAAMVA